MPPSQFPLTEREKARERLVWALAGGLLVLHVILAWLRRMPGVLTGEDEAIYLLLARQVAHLGYSDVFLAGQPMHAMYPPGYPAALAVWGALVGNRFDGLLLLSILCSAAALLLAFVSVRARWSAGVALLVLAVLAVNPFLIERAGALASEAPYMLFTMVALWGAARGDRRSLVIAGSAAVAAALTRSIGMTVLAALAANWIWGRRFAAAAVGTGVALATAGWLVWTFTAPGKLVGASYAADFTQGGVPGGAAHALPAVLAGRIVTNVPAYLTVTIPSLLPLPAVGGIPWDNAVTAALSIAGLALGSVALWRSWRVAALYLGATGAVLAVWPWHLERFLMPVLPILVIAVLLGTGSLIARRWPQRRVASMAVLAAVLVITGLAQVASDLSATARCDRGQSPPAPSCVTDDQASFFAALDYVRRNLPRDAVLLTPKRATAYWYTGRKQIQWQRAAAAGPGLVEFLRREHVGYVILGSLHWADLDQIPAGLEPNCGAVALVQSFPPRTYLLRVRAPDEQDDGSGCRALAEHRAQNAGRDFERNS